MGWFSNRIGYIYSIPNFKLFWTSEMTKESVKNAWGSHIKYAMSSKTWRSFHDLEMFFQYIASQKYFIANNIVHRTVTSVCYLPLITSDTPHFSCAFANLRTANVSFVMSVCLPVCPNGIIRFPLGGFDGILHFIVFTRAVRKVKNVCAHSPRSCFIVPDQSFGMFSRV
jgi:hypothetical protein